MTDLYVYCVSFRGLSRILALLGCGVTSRQRPQTFRELGGDRHPVARRAGGSPGLVPDPQADLPSWVAGDETWLSLGGVKRPVAVVLGPRANAWTCA